MATKTTTASRSKPKKSTGTAAKKTGKSTASAPKKGRPTKSEQAARQAKKERELRNQRRRTARAISLMALGTLLLLLACFRDDALVWRAVRRCLFGVFGLLTYAIGPVLIGLGIVCAAKRNVDRADALRWSLLAFSVSSATYCFSIARPSGHALKEIVPELYAMGQDEVGTGLISAILGYPMDTYLGAVGGKITASVLVAACLMLVTNTTPLDLYRWISVPCIALARSLSRAAAAIRKRREERREREESLEAIRATREYEEKAKRINVPMATEKKRPIDIALREDECASFDPVKEKKRHSRLSKLPNIDVDLGPDFDPSAEGISLNPAGPAATVVKDVMRKEAAENAQNAEIFAQFSGREDKPFSEFRAANAHFEEANRQLEQVAAQNRENKTKVVEVDAEVAALAKKADSEYLKNVSASAARQEKPAQRNYKLPPVSLLERQVNVNEKSIEQELSANAELLVNTLDSFGVHAKVIDISRGPTVTRYELQPEIGVRLNRITQLSDDIALNMAAVSVRIEAPIPGKAAVGIEIPNQIVQTVNLRPVIESEEFAKGKGSLLFALGKDVSGAVKVGDIEKMPHLLIAGATGMGKSVCINSILISLLYKYSPDELKLILVDPKMVEFTAYNGLPHLYLPVVTDPRKAAGALGWAVCEMLKRYRRFSETGCRNITEYNNYVKKLLSNPDYEPEEGEEMPALLPRVVIIIDELADLMMAAPNEVEDAIARLAQMARAAGMHLILATQRPSVDVITGVIKNNIPSRIAFAVSSQVDSRTIIDGAGAEKLLGRGDMLYMPVGQTKSTRIQGCFVTDEEVARVVKYIKDRNGAEYDDAVMKEIERNMPVPKGSKNSGSAADDDAEDGEDEMFNEAVEVVLDAGQASTSMLQRKCRLGYARAARIMDRMEEMGIISEAEGSKPRQVLISKQQWLERMTSQGG